MNIAVVGAAGNMGKWFTAYFVRGGHKVKIYDLKKKAAEAFAEEVGAEYADTISQCIIGCDTILLSVPIDSTPGMIARVAKLIEDKVLLIEITSMKTRVIRALKRLPRHITPLSIHPLFGPGLKDPRLARIIVVKVRDAEHEVELAKNLFPEAQILKSNVVKHDKMVAYSLTLPYFINLAYGLSTLDLKVAELRQYAGTTLSIQLDILEAIIQSSRHLIPTILAKNPYSHKVVNRYLKAAQTLNKQLKKKAELEKILTRLERNLSSDPAYQKAYQSLYYLAEKKGR